MALIYVCDHLSDKPVRRTVNNIRLDGTVNEFKQIACTSLGISVAIEAVFCGIPLRDDNSLESYGVRPGVTIYFLKKLDKTPTAVETLDSATANQVISAFRASLTNPVFRSTAEKILMDNSTVQRLVDAVPDLRHDYISMALLQSPGLLLSLAMNIDKLKKVVHDYPLFGQAAMVLASRINEDSRRVLADGASVAGEESTEEDARAALGPPQPEAWRPVITPDQLAAALASTSAHSPHTQQLPPQPAAPSSQITEDFFRQAMLSVAPQGQGQVQNIQQPSLEEELHQLREMGITDQALARRALELTGGNVQAALELIFGGMD